MAGLRGQIRDPQADVRVRRNFDNLAEVLQFISPNSPIQIGDDGTFELVLTPDGGLHVVSGGLAIELATVSGLSLTGGLHVVAAGVLETTAGGVVLNFGDGLEDQGGSLAVSLAANPGLEFSAGDLRALVAGVLGLDASGIHLRLGDGVENDGSGNLRVQLDALSGLARSSDGLSIAANAPLYTDGSGLHVEVGDGLQVGTGDDLEVSLADTSLEFDTGALRVKLDPAGGLTVGPDGLGGGGGGSPMPGVTMATPGNTITQTINVNTVEILNPLGTLERDTDGFFDSMTPDRLTIPAGMGGMYLVSYGAGVDPGSTGTMRTIAFNFLINAVTFTGSRLAYLEQGTTRSSFSFVRPFNAGDEIQFTVFADNPGGSGTTTVRWPNITLLKIA